MKPHHVDYDSIAAKYAERYDGRPLAGVAAALEPLRRGRVLEAGCGTGHWLRPGDYGVDLSFEMVRQSEARVAQASAVALPFRDSTFDLVFAVNAIHHFGDPESFVRQARRVLRPGGSLAIVGMSPQMQRGAWWIYDYFEGTYERDLLRFPSWGALVDWALEAGFRDVSWRVVERVTGHRTGKAIFDDPFLPKHSASQLALLSGAEYAAGIARIEAAVAADPEVLFRWDLVLGMLVVR